MFIADIKRVIEQVSRDKGINREVLIKALEEALESAARKKFGTKVDIEVQYNEVTGEIEVFQFKDVAEEITEPDLQISLEEGRKLDLECEVGDSLGTKMDTSTFGRIAAQSAKQVIIQKMKDAERDAVFSSFIGRKGEIINGIVQRFDRNDIIVNLGQTEGILPTREQIPKESYRRGDRIRAYIMDVLHETRGPQIILSRTHPDFLICLFKTEVPEISEGIVTIMGAVREPGIRAKFAVSSNDSDIDPVGACVGMKGSRVQNVVQELRGEKIDIISWHIDSAKFVCNALAPAEISRVIIDEDNLSMEVIVPDEFLSIAIGKRGQNVRLASKLTKWHLDVISETRYSKAMQDAYKSLVSLPGVGISMADALYEKGFFSAEELSNSSVKDLIQIRGIAEEKAMQLIETAKKYVASTDLVDELPNEALPNDELDSDEISGGSDVQEVLKEETIDETSKEAIPDNELDDDEISAGSDVQEVLKEETIDETSKEAIPDNGLDDDEISGGSDVQEALKEESIDETSKEAIPDNGLDDDEISAGSDVRKVLKENSDSDEQMSGHSLLADNAAEDDG